LRLFTSPRSNAKINKFFISPCAGRASNFTCKSVHAPCSCLDVRLSTGYFFLLNNFYLEHGFLRSAKVYKLLVWHAQYIVVLRTPFLWHLFRAHCSLFSFKKSRKSLLLLSFLGLWSRLCFILCSIFWFLILLIFKSEFEILLSSQNKDEKSRILIFCVHFVLPQQRHYLPLAL